jgi:TRAP transporter TAXI family solute receptor
MSPARIGSPVSARIPRRRAERQPCFGPPRPGKIAGQFGRELVNKTLLAAVAVLALGFAADADAQTRVTLKSAQTGTSYYLMTVQIGEALKAASGGKLTATVEESQGSVQNVKEAARRPGNFVFTTPPGLLEDARAGKKPFEGESGYDAIRGLFPIPGITMHWIVRADAGVNNLTDLAGKDFVARPASA